MYQKHEIVIKKNAEMTTAEECRICTETGDAMEFYREHIAYYLDMLKMIEAFGYGFEEDDLESGESQPLLQFEVNRNETDEELRLCIEEFWDDHFELEYLNPLFEDRFKPGVDFDEVPKALRVLLKSVDFHDYLQIKFAENHEKFGDDLKYNCISRYFDELCNGEEAIGIFDHDENQYKRLGYGLGDHGWTGEIMEGNTVDRSFLKQFPDKKWYSISPQIGWFPHVLFEDDSDEMYEVMAKVLREDMGHFEDEFGSAIGMRYPFTDNEVAYEYSDGTAEDGFQVRGIYGFESLDEYKSEYDTITSEQVLNLIETLEKLNKDFLKIQEGLAKKHGDNFDDFRNEGFYSRMLFYSNDYDILYIEADSTYENGFRTGEIKVHSKNFKQD